ncbi:phosphotransferase [Streptomyces phaeochromogenes]|uniref:phosphotransferase n=1 Tax=Streptomyces phaeochromogenes TaxID=1923 RepID=UPI002DDBE056|nr:phosphotransferase [Streptomyces phaeochromogenes]WRZ32641.1 phosphotransferase [Streptomyces phaeochromogenes]
MGIPAEAGRLLGSGRTADVYALDDGGDHDGLGDHDGPGGGAWVLRRYRDGYGDAPAEAAVMEYVRGHGYPVPRVRAAADARPRTDLVMERLYGPTVVEALAAGQLTAGDAGLALARLLRDLHAIPARRSTDPAVRVLHLDLHPENVLLTPAGPMVIDWANTGEGPPGRDWSMSAVIVAQVAVDDDPRAPLAEEMLSALLAGCPDPALLTGPDGGLGWATGQRAANPTMSPREVELLGEAGELIRRLLA